jgi:Mn-dependent DtxR family transcriptional regulator
MSRRIQTPDERLMVKLYEKAMENGDPFTEVDVRGVAKAIGQKETATKNIVKHLAQANFLSKADESNVFLTRRGCDFVLEILEEFAR